MRQLLAIILLIVGTSVVPAQKESADAPERAICSLKAAEAPAIGALRLGMTTEQVLALFPGSKEDAEIRSSLSKPASPLGVSNFVVRPSKFQTKEKYAGVSQITFNLLDGRVSSFSIVYDGPEWPHVDKFVAKVIEGTKLPPVDSWQEYPGMETQLKFLTCEDFEVRVFSGGQGGSQNYVLMSDLAAARTLKERRVKAREKQESKP